MSLEFKCLTRSSKVISDLFPFYLELEANFRIVTMGRSMVKVATDVVYGNSLEMYFIVKNPNQYVTDNLRTFIEKGNTSKSLTITHRESKVQFRAQIYQEEESSHLFFVCSPAISNYSGKDNPVNLKIDDYAAYDTMPDFLFAMQAQGSSIDEMERINQHLTNQRRELMRMNEELENYVSVASHDLQSPLRNIVGFSQLLTRDLQNEIYVNLEVYAKVIADNGIRMKQTLDDLLKYATLKQNDEKKTLFSLDMMMQAVKNSLKSEIEESGAVIYFDQFVSIRANPSQMTRLFINLIGNAIKFRKKDECPIIHISCTEIGDDLLVKVKDNGIGIEEKYQKKIFKLFQRLHKMSEYVGTGVGLPICQRIVEYHAGEIWVHSELNVGSTFSFRIRKS